MKFSLSPDEFKEILLSHHPNHPCFDDDVVIISGRRICAGCLLAYPTALLVLVVFRPSGIESIIIAVLLAIISLTRRISKNRHLNFFFRFVAGIALGFGAGGLLWAIQARDIFAVAFIILGGFLYGWIRYKSMKKKIRDTITG